MLESGFPAVVVLSAGQNHRLRECLLTLFLCFIGCFRAYRLDQFIEEVLVNGLSFKITLFGLAQFSSDNFGRHFSHSEQEHVCKKAVEGQVTGISRHGHVCVHCEQFFSAFLVGKWGELYHR